MKPLISQQWQDAAELAEHLLESHNGHINVAMPLGLGKANHLINALYEQVRDNSAMSLTIVTALTLQSPQTNDGIAGHFFAPIRDRLYANYPELLYARDLLEKKLPANVHVSEFFLQAGLYLNNTHSQSHYISANYSHVSSFILDKKIDLVIQMVAHDRAHTSDLSLSCNPDITLELLAARKAGDTNFSLIAELNDSLPFMPNDAQLPESEFAHILSGKSAEAALFNIPKAAVDFPTYAAGFHASSLIKDGGTLQIGIGSTGDAIAYALILRHNNNAAYKQIISALNGGQEVQNLQHLELDPFDIGLYGVSEMFVDVFLDLIEAGVIKREVDNMLIHGGFFLGPKSMYQRLNDMPDSLRKKINMTAIGYINAAHYGFLEKQQKRKHARFVNNAMKVTLLGAVVSDGLASGKVVSGVGGQYDFVSQSFALRNARSIIMLKALRHKNGKLISNIVWDYGHITIPRHLRDIVINEYGIADLRGAADKDVIAAMLSITDCKFQKPLLKLAQRNNKTGVNVAIEKDWKTNTQEHLNNTLSPFKALGLLPDYPFGTDFDDFEQALIPILQELKTCQKSKLRLLTLIIKGLKSGKNEAHLPILERLGLLKPASIKSKITQLALLGLLSRQ